MGQGGQDIYAMIYTNFSNQSDYVQVWHRTR